MRSPLQNKLLEMMIWLDNFLNQNHLIYYMVGGTMLGAMRHEGFIPWDDDIDIAMPRKDYENVIELLKKPIEHYIIEGPLSENKDFIYSSAKFYDLDTTLIEDAKKPILRGVFIDIFPLDGIGNSKEESLKNFRRVDRINMILAMKVCKYRKQRVWWKNIAAFIGYCLPVSAKKLAIKIDALSKRVDYDSSSYITTTMSTNRAKEIMLKKVYGIPKKYQFEGRTFYGIENADEYLTLKFNNWHALPPVEKRETAHDFIEIDLNKGWRENENNSYIRDF